MCLFNFYNSVYIFYENLVNHFCEAIAVAFKGKLLPRILTQTTSSFVYICDLLFRGFTVIGCFELKREREYTTPIFIKNSLALGSKDDMSARENNIAALCFHIRFVFILS